MKWSFTVARIAGTQVRIHITFILLLAWIGMAYWVSEGPAAAFGGVLFILLIFLCVLLHEFGHAAAALRYGITTPKITLLPFGGLASISRMPKEPMQEMVIAVAGPLVNVVIAAVLLLIRQGFPEWNPDIHLPGHGSLLDRLIWINLLLVGFNMIPAFPMDGGRVFRAFLSLTFPRDKATVYAAILGQALAVAGGILALSMGQPILFLIAIFIFFAAASEATMVQTEHVLEGLNASDASMGEFHTLTMEDTVHRAIDLMLDSSQADFPVLNDLGQCIGIATRNDIVRTLREEGLSVPIANVVQDIPLQIDANVPVLEAWQKLQESKLPAAAVVDETGRLVRWLTTENISELIMTRSAARDFLHH